MSVTIREVARHSGVSIATVSRVINNTAEVAEITKQRVESAIEDLGYSQPSPSVRSLQKALRTIGLLMPDINNLHFPAVIWGMETFLFHHEYSLFICNTDEDPNMERSYMRTLTEKGVEAIAFLGTRHEDEPNEHIVELSETIPVIMIDDNIIGSNVYSVMNDEVDGAYQAIEHLIKLGHRDIAYVCGDGGYTTSRYKSEGYLKALEAHGIPALQEFQLCVDPHEHGGHMAGNILLDRASPPTAVFAENDQLAMGIIRSALERNFKIPGDLSVVGFSDSPIAKELFPPLTSVNQFAVRTGEIAAETLLRVINGKTSVQRRIMIQPELSVRRSTGPIIRKD